MAKSIQDILGGRQMTGVVKTVASGIPNYVPTEFMNTTKRIVGNRSTFLQVQGQRAGGRTVQYGAPAQRRTMVPLAEIGVTLMHVYEEMIHDPLVLQNLMGQNGNAAAEVSAEEVDRQTVEFKRLCDTARLMALYSTLRNGKIWIGANGDLLLSSSNAVITVDFGVPTSNVLAAGGGTIVDWAVASNSIVYDVQNVKKTAIKTTGRELGYAFYGQNILKYILANTEAKALIAANPVLLNAVYQTGEIPDGFCGLKWRPCYRAFGLDTSATATDYWGADTLVFCPDPSTDWWQWQEGSYLVPRSVGNVYPSAEEAVRDVDIVYGQFAYGVLLHNPVTVAQYVGDTFMPVLASPNDLYIATVH